MDKVDESEIHDNDVRCGRGHGSNRHPGNIDYREIVNERREKYQNEKRYFEKSMIAKGVLTIIKEKDPPGRFLEQDSKTEKWKIISDELAEKKIKQCLREGEKQGKSSPSSRRQSHSDNNVANDVVSAPTETALNLEEESSNAAATAAASRTQSEEEEDGTDLANAAASVSSSTEAMKRAIETELYNIVQPRRGEEGATNFDQYEETTSMNVNIDSLTGFDGSKNNQASTTTAASSHHHHHQEQHDERFVHSDPASLHRNSIEDKGIYHGSCSSLKQSVAGIGVDPNHGWNMKGQSHRHAELFSPQHPSSDPRSLYSQTGSEELYYKDHSLNRNIAHDNSRSLDVEHQHHDPEKGTSPMPISEENHDSQKKSHASIMNASIMSVDSSDVSLEPENLAAPGGFSPFKSNNRNQGESLGLSQNSDSKEIPYNIMMVDSVHPHFGDSLLSLGECWFPNNQSVDTTTAKLDASALDERERMEYLDDNPKDNSSSNVAESGFFGQPSKSSADGHDADQGES